MTLPILHVLEATQGDSGGKSVEVAKEARALKNAEQRLFKTVKTVVRGKAGTNAEEFLTAVANTLTWKFVS